VIDRREWLLVVGGGLLAACAAPSTDAPPKAQPVDSKESPKSVSTVPAPRACRLKLTAAGRKLGRLYHGRTPGEASEDALRAALPQGIAALMIRISADYAGDDVVVLSGWILARTEARLLALADLEGGCATL
jgi:hypothetical protein